LKFKNKYLERKKEYENYIKNFNITINELSQQELEKDFKDNKRNKLINLFDDLKKLEEWKNMCNENLKKV